MRYFKVFLVRLVRIIKLFICVLWFITKILSNFTWEQMARQRIIRNVNIDVQNKLLVGVKFEVARFHECGLEGGKGWYFTLLKNTWKLLHYLDGWNQGPKWSMLFLKIIFWPQFKFFMLLKIIIANVKLLMGITLEGLKCL